jgi:hypothetical protein
MKSPGTSGGSTVDHDAAAPRPQVEVDEGRTVQRVVVLTFQFQSRLEAPSGVGT